MRKVSEFKEEIKKKYVFYFRIGNSEINSQ